MGPALATELADLRADAAHLYQRGSVMNPRITTDMLEAYLHCQYKGHLKEAGEPGRQSDYEAVSAELRADVRRRVHDKGSVGPGAETGHRGGAGPVRASLGGEYASAVV
jgi:hypothetical protein